MMLEAYLCNLKGRVILKKCFGLQTGESFETSAIFGSYVTLLEIYRANSHCSIEKHDFENLLSFTGHKLLLPEKSYGFRKV